MLEQKEKQAFRSFLMRNFGWMLDLGPKKGLSQNGVLLFSPCFKSQLHDFAARAGFKSWLGHLSVVALCKLLNKTLQCTPCKLVLRINMKWKFLKTLCFLKETHHRKDVLCGSIHMKFSNRQDQTMPKEIRTVLTSGQSSGTHGEGHTRTF